MALKLMYITNNPKVASIAERAGVDRIFIDMEYIGKSKRQGGMDTVQNHHTIADISLVKKAINNSEIVVRVNPLHDKTTEYDSSEEEINAAINAGADLIMLPYFKSSTEVKQFIDIVNGRAKTFLLLESLQAYIGIDEILSIPGIDEIHIGMNDLSLDMKKKFMFELLADGTVEQLCNKFKQKGIPYGFGGIGRLGRGDLPAEYIVKEHYRLGSSCAILSRSFCNTNLITDLTEIEAIFEEGIKEIRALEDECIIYSNYFNSNKCLVKEKVHALLETIL